MSLRVLIVAPEVVELPGLMSAREIDTIAPSHDTDVIAGEVTQSRIAGRASKQHYDIIHFVAHGDDGGVRLSDGIMKPEDILQLARHTRAKLVFFNACDSTIPGQLLIDTGVPAAIVHNRAVLDQDALRLAAYFYAELATNGGDLRGAYHVANPRDGSLSWLSNGNYREQDTEVLLGEIETIQETTRRRDVQMKTMERRLNYLGIAIGFNALMTAAVVLRWIVGF